MDTQEVQAPHGLQLDLLAAVARLQQISDEGGFYGDGPVGLFAVRLLTCDLPRLRAYLTPETLAWAESVDEPVTQPDEEPFPLRTRERGRLIDGLMVLMHGMKQVKENDLSEMPELQALLERLMAPMPGAAAPTR